MRTHECVLDLHRALVCLSAVGGNVETTCDRGNSDAQNDLGEVLSPANAASDTERDHILRHPKTKGLDAVKRAVFIIH